MPTRVGNQMKSKEYIALQKEWYEKLKREGFDDLEYFYDNGEAREWLKGTSKFVSMETEEVHNPSLTYDNTLDYYLKVDKILETTLFDSEEHKYIFTLHTEGLSLRKIAKLVNFSHPKVLRIINKYKAKA